MGFLLNRSRDHTNDPLLPGIGFLLGQDTRDSPHPRKRRETTRRAVAALATNIQTNRQTNRQTDGQKDKDRGRDKGDLLAPAGAADKGGIRGRVIQKTKWGQQETTEGGTDGTQCAGKYVCWLYG